DRHHRGDGGALGGGLGGDRNDIPGPRRPGDARRDRRRAQGEPAGSLRSQAVARARVSCTGVARLCPGADAGPLAVGPETRGMKRFWNERELYLLLSLAVAVVMWLYVATGQNPVVSRQVRI